MMRYFKLYSVTAEGGSPPISLEDVSGRYKGKNAKTAAYKIFCKICKNAAVTECTYVFSIQEITKNLENTIWEFRGTRYELDEPKKITVGDKEIVMKFINNVSCTGQIYMADGVP